MTEDIQKVRVRLFNLLYRRFNLDELRTLCYLLDVDYEELAGETKSGKTRELLAHLERREGLGALIEQGKTLRPDVHWPDAPPPSSVPDPTGCVFISYSRKDQTYARRLAAELRERGCTPWMDDRIDFGDLWWQTIVRAVRACAAFVVVMTPEAERSRWVEREVLLAEDEGKPILPLLLRGRGLPLLINVQHVDVTGDRMPSHVFYDRLNGVLERSDVSRPRELPVILTPRQPFEPEMVFIPAGEFLMGSDPARDRYAQDDERPQHTVSLPDYYLARASVTNAQYLAFVQAAGQRAPRHWVAGKPPEGKKDHPVVNVSWHDALAYCRWLAEATGKPYRLPSEAEWEKGARGTEGRIYPWGNQWDAARCNSAEGNKRDTTPVGAYPDGASPYGLLDMAGNVWEWTRTLWGRGYPYVPDDGREDLEGDAAPVVRGGAFDDYAKSVRCACRLRNLPGIRDWDDGFRVCVVGQWE